ncbi:MAG TPA: DUF4389 domain-containing protein [archaeon]|nr:DUF4389 domain-containing protein [archaeon]
MDSVKIKIKSEEKASRIELLIRFLYLIPLWIVLMVLSMIATIGIVVNFFTSLVLGKRIAILNRITEAYIIYQTEVSAYLYLTDERPKIIPEI